MEKDNLIVMIVAIVAVVGIVGLVVDTMQKTTFSTPTIATVTPTTDTATAGTNTVGNAQFNPNNYCGDGRCADATENSVNCPQDCGSSEVSQKMPSPRIVLSAWGNNINGGTFIWNSDQNYVQISETSGMVGPFVLSITSKDGTFTQQFNSAAPLQSIAWYPSMGAITYYDLNKESSSGFINTVPVYGRLNATYTISLTKVGGRTATTSVNSQYSTILQSCAVKSWCDAKSWITQDANCRQIHWGCQNGCVDSTGCY